ncbi:hypothetical protein ES705_42657 [subsurface metagenome]
MNRSREIKFRRVAPKIRSDEPVVVELWVRAGGRCEFHGCNKYLLQDELTTNRVKLAHIGHIVARSRDGPRGDDPLPITKRNKIDNLILLCTKCHKLIDDKKLEKQYTKEILQGYKKEHENRIKFLSSFGQEYETVVIRMLSKIKGYPVSISHEEIRKAVLGCAGRYPRYLGAENNIEINLTGLPLKINKSYWKTGTIKIDEIFNRHIIPAIDEKRIKHMSVFALAHIPFLIYLGYSLGDKVPTSFYQKHHTGSETWVWHKTGNLIRFKDTLLRKGKDDSKIAVILSISGKISSVQLPPTINSDFTVYEITPEDVTPNRNILLLEKTLNEFSYSYQNLLRKIEKSYRNVRKIHLFPAVPIAAAIVCGRELMRNVSPSILIYDKTKRGYKPTMEVN